MSDSGSWRGGIALWSSEPNAWIMLPFGGVFAGMGAMVIRVFAKTPGMKRVVLNVEEFQTGRSTHRSISYIEVDENASDTEIARIKRERIGAKLATRPDWAEGRIASERRRSGNAYWYIAAAIAVLWSVSIGAAVFFDAFAWFFTAILSLFLGIVLWLAVSNLLHRRKFSEAELLLDSTPALLGETFEAEIRGGIHRDTKISEDAELTLTCVHSWEVRTRDSDGKSQTRTRRKTLWEDTRRVTVQRQGGRPSVTVPVRFEMPEDQPQTTPGDSHGIHWHLHARVRLPGLDWRAEFEVPVFALDSVEARLLG
ncbi:MAG: hypothetical protein AAF415_10005 [Pseudomonadota bacterium]